MQAWAVTIAAMDDIWLGLAFRAARIRRRLRQADLAQSCGLSRPQISRIERGQCGQLSLDTLRQVAGILEIQLEMAAKWHGGELEHLVNRRHAALGERVAAWIAGQPGWTVVAEVSFSLYGERGVIDLLAWHEASGSLVVIELKTAIVDVGGMLGTFDRKRRLAARVAMDRGWRAKRVCEWLIVADSHTNRRRIGEHRSLLASTLSLDGRSFGSQFHRFEDGVSSGTAFWPNDPGASADARLATPLRAFRPRKAPDAASKPSGSPLQASSERKMRDSG